MSLVCPLIFSSISRPDEERSYPMMERAKCLGKNCAWFVDFERVKTKEGHQLEERCSIRIISDTLRSKKT